jgi:hypothetical protein
MEGHLKNLALLQQKKPGNETQECNLNEVFANRSKEKEIFPLTTPEIAEAQRPMSNSNIASGATQF